MLFPFEKAILTGEAEVYVKFGVVNETTFEAVKRASYYDPYAARFLSLKMQYAFIMQDNKLGIETYNQLKTLAPNMPILKRILITKD